jgi:hypothetical protein
MNSKSPINKTINASIKKNSTNFNIFKWMKDLNETEMNIGKQDMIIDQACKLRTELKKKRAQLTREGNCIYY